jgi:outer membrane protein TolC
MQLWGIAIVVALAMTAASWSPAPAAETVFNVEQLIAIAYQGNPSIKAARERWMSAQHSIKQAYAPNDPIFSYNNSDSPQNPFGPASLRQWAVSEPFQFPGKAALQTDQAKRTAQIARLTYETALRDTRAAVETGYYQLVLDETSAAVNQENVENLERVLKVTQIAYTASQVTQTDFISAEFDLAAARQQQAQYRVAILNDKTALNQLLYRNADEPLAVETALKLDPLRERVDRLVDEAWEVRQEILQSALTERNFTTALYLAKMEYLPDFSMGFTLDNYRVPSFAPKPTQTTDWSVEASMNVPIFFWLKQSEDVERARHDLEAARDDMASLRSQTAATVTTLFRSAQYQYATSLLYRDTLTPLARQNFEVALIAYQSGKIDFTTLAAALQREYGSRISYLQAANQFLAGRVALEQTIGMPLPQ